ncbi:hypothetical protein AND_006081 [Anopheles darlingi]|uniref:Centriolar and ciliogenesis-associated protein HYLS1 C-terminal domain-containing protein n=1 Tax=Anopheles darlingi TaxID=43151 RepID=W5JH45_ANODA|nr:uncharacterized protein LOC125950974 [Anopheles darlingi]ETN62235.1 hypothetical protein AND_006081 [Anopheles darlingi]
MSLPLDAGEILTHLNQLGYRNVTAEQLKEFQKDLQKLIKFDTQIYRGHPDAPPENVFERLHSEKTISYRAKQTRATKKTDVIDSSDKENQAEATNKTAAAASARSKDDKSTKMWIRPKSSQSFRRSDPVALYHSYQKDWNKFKLPGENDHSELRWKIRTKLLGE